MSARLGELARSLAPVVRLHPGEPFAPLAAGDLVEASDLIWREPDESHLVLASGPGGAGAGPALEPLWLGAVSELSREACPYDVAGYVPGDFTRPFDRSWPQGPAGAPLAAGAGFALLPGPGHDLGRAAGPGDLAARLAGCPAYWEAEEVRGAGGEVTGHILCFWLFFGASTLPAGLVAAAGDGWRRLLDRAASAAREIAGGRLGSLVDLLTAPGGMLAGRLGGRPWLHQGDWEGVSLLVDAAGRPASARFRAHGVSTPVPADAVEWRGPGGEHLAAWQEGARPVVHCALGSHACLPSRDGAAWPDVAPGEDAVEWDTAAGPILEAAVQPWYGFGGAWGDPDLAPGAPRAAGLDIQRHQFVGPLGPSRYKAAREVWPA